MATAYLWTVYRRAYDPAVGHVMMMVYASPADLNEVLTPVAHLWGHHMVSSNYRATDEADIVLPAGGVRLALWMETWDG